MPAAAGALIAAVAGGSSPCSPRQPRCNGLEWGPAWFGIGGERGGDDGT